MSKTNAEIQKAYRDRQKAAGFKEVRNLYARPKHHERIKRYVARLNRK